MQRGREVEGKAQSDLSEPHAIVFMLFVAEVSGDISKYSLLSDRP